MSRLSSRLAGAQSAQPAQAGSASGQSTPSNLERAVLLLEAETESVSIDSKVSAVISAVSSPSQPSGGSGTEAEEPNSSMASDRAPERQASLAAGVKEQPAEHKEAPSDRAGSADLDAHRTALMRLNLAGSQGGSAGGSDSADEGPRTPPASSAAARADTKASSSPNSPAGEPRISLSTWCCISPVGNLGDICSRWNPSISSLLCQGVDRTTIHALQWHAKDMARQWQAKDKACMKKDCHAG